MLEYYRRFFARRQPWSVDLDSTIRDINRDAGGRIDRLIFPNYDRTARLGELALPTLFVVGQYDDVTPGTARFYQGLVPGAELAVIEGAGHLPMQDEPDRYVRVLGAFLQRVDSLSHAP
jgi:proline iminopeptidase